MISEEYAGRLWQRFKDFYGQKWASLFQGQESIESWRVTWSTLDANVEEIKYALANVVRFYPEWPPTYGQFQSLCNEGRKQQAPLPLAEPKPEPPSPERLAELKAAAVKISRNDNRKYWTPDVVVNARQVQFIVMQANHFGERSYAAQFLRDCIAAGVITSDHQLAKG